mgnify:CR=1 FL=1
MIYADAIWFVFWVLVIPTLIMWSLSTVLESRSTIRGPRSMARKLTPHEYSLKWQRAEWERRRRERKAV